MIGYWIEDKALGPETPGNLIGPFRLKVDARKWIRAMGGKVGQWQLLYDCDGTGRTIAQNW